MTYYSPSDARAAHPELDPDQPIPLDQFAGLITDYKFPKQSWVECQLHHDGRICHTRHGWGFIARRKDGILGFMGNVCAHTHGGLDSDFAMKFRVEERRLKKEREIANLVGRIAAYKQIPSLTEDLCAELVRHASLYQETLDVRSALPRSVQERLADMVKTGNRNIQAFTVRVVMEREANGSERKRVIRNQFLLGSIAAPNAIDISELRHIGKALNDALIALRECVADPKVEAKQLKQWADALDGCALNASALDATERGLRQFLEFENLQLLPWLAESGRDRDQIAEFFLKRQGLPHDPGRCQSALAKLQNEIINREGGLPFVLA